MAHEMQVHASHVNPHCVKRKRGSCYLSRFVIVCTANDSQRTFAFVLHDATNTTTTGGTVQVRTNRIHLRMAAMPLFNSGQCACGLLRAKCLPLLTDHRDSPEAAMSCSVAGQVSQ
jgi:hypothetical protein